MLGRVFVTSQKKRIVTEEKTRSYDTGLYSGVRTDSFDIDMPKGGFLESLTATMQASNAVGNTNRGTCSITATGSEDGVNFDIPIASNSQTGSSVNFSISSGTLETNLKKIRVIFTGGSGVILAFGRRSTAFVKYKEII